MRLGALVLLLGAVLPRASPAAILCVRPGGGAGCHAAITSALTAASDGDTIRIAAGTYAGNLVVTKNVTLEGGWDGDFSRRDPVAFHTSILATAGSGSAVVSIYGSSVNPAQSTSRLDGLSIANGRADLGNNSGGGLRIVDSHARIVGCTIAHNAAFGAGGGVFVQRGAPRFEGTRIEDNRVEGGTVPAGGGVMIEDGSASFVGCSIARNQIAGFGGLGGGIAIANPGSGRDQTLRIEASTLRENAAGPAGQGYGGGISAQGLETPLPGTAGVFLDRVRVEANDGRFAGGGVHAEDTPLVVTNSVFAGNRGSHGNALYHAASGSEPASAGAARNCTLLGPGDGTGSGIVAGGPFALVNSIVAGHALGLAYAGPDGQLQASHDAFFDNTRDVDAGPGFALDASHRFVDPQLDAAQHLLPGSPLVDAGTRTPGPFRDIDGEPRPAAGRGGRFVLDIGADEAPGEAQRVHAVDRGEYDLLVVGPGDPPENPGTSAGDEAIGHALLGADWSGDGIDDLLVFAADWSNDAGVEAERATGRGLGLLGASARRLGVLDLGLDPQADLQIRSELARQHLGAALASGDLDADGWRDVAIAGPGEDGAPIVLPAVFVLRGGPGLGGTRTLSASRPADFTLLAPAPDALAFARRNALAIGDLSGDGIDDLVVGDALADDGDSAAAGAVFVILGRAGLSGMRDLAGEAADLTVLGPAAGAGLGLALALADLDADGALDLAANDATTTHLLFGPLAPGVRRLASAPADARVANLGGPGLIALDLSGEGALDLVGSSESLRLVRGPFATGRHLDAASAASLVLTGAGPFASLASADVLGDARAELLVGQTSVAGLGGIAYAVSAGARASGTLPIHELASLAVVDTTGAQPRLGTAVAAGDLDGDGRADWLVTDPGAGPLAPRPAEARDAGRSYVFYGGAAVDNCPGISNPDQADADGDGAGDACDPCPYYASASFADTDGDGRGDVCECTDQDGDGRNTVSDLVAISAAIFDPARATPLCDGNGDGRCDVGDLIAANLEIFSPENSSTCARQPAPGP